MQNIFNAQKQIEQTLRYLTTIAEQAKEGIVVADLDGSLIFVNQAWIEMHGYSSKEKFIGKQISLFRSKEQMNSDLTALFEENNNCSQSEGIVEHIKSDGTTFPIQAKTILLKNESGESTGLIIFATDINKNTKLQETTAENLKQAKHLNERITQIRKLLIECLEAEETCAAQTGELQSYNEMLMQQLSDLEKSSPISKQRPEQIAARKAKTSIADQPAKNIKPDQKPEEATAMSSDMTVKSKKSMKPLNTKELEDVAKLARRLSEFPSFNLQNNKEILRKN